MNESAVGAIERLHERLGALEARVCRTSVLLTGVQGIRIMRIVALMSGNPFRYELVRKDPGRSRRWC